MTLYEKLTARELDILRCLAERLSNQEIAARFTLSLNSVKWYTRQIYDKLGVGTRAEAVARASALGILGGETPAPPPAAHDNLPVELTSLVGRERELDEIAGLLNGPATRLLTLTGSGGCGKTRLALRTGTNQGWRYPLGAWFLELAPLTDPGAVVPAVAAGLGLLPDAGCPPLQTVLGFLKDRQALLVLDNCEHVIEAAAQLALAVLSACPKVRILATSREPLGVPGEVTYRVPSLPVPPEDWDGQLAVPAAQLFLERAAAVRPGFALEREGEGEGAAAALARICRRLDGIPLAIELAAARVSALSVQEIAGRLEESFELLSGGSRALLQRQQTLRASIDWSYRLLAAEEQSLLARLAVFAGGWTLEAAEFAGRGLGEAEQRAPVIDSLASLVNKSLVVADTARARPRYRMLETIRQYAVERLRAADGLDAAQASHLAYFRTLAETLEPRLRGPDQVELLDSLEEELGNIRAALRFALAHPDALEEGLRLATALRWLWNNRSMHVEGAAWLRSLLDAQPADWMSAPEQMQRRARALVDCAHFYLWEETNPAISVMLEEARALYEALGSAGRAGMVWLLYVEETHYSRLGDGKRGKAAAVEMLALAEELDDRFGIAEALNTRLSYAETPEEALGWMNRGLAIRRELGDIDGLFFTMHARSYTYWWKLGDIERAWQDAQEAVAYARQSKNKRGISQSMNFMGWSACLGGDPERGMPLMEQSLALVRETGSAGSIGNHLLAIAVVRMWLNAVKGSAYPTRAYFDEALQIARDNRIVSMEADIRFHQAEEAWANGDPRAGERYLEAAAALERIASARFDLLRRYCLGKAALTGGERQGANENFRQALRIAVENGLEWEGIYCLAALAAAWAGSPQDAARLARLQGAADRLAANTRIFDVPGSPLFLPFPPEAVLDPARAALGEAEFAAAYRSGEGLTLAQAAAAALEWA